MNAPVILAHGGGVINAVVFMIVAGAIGVGCLVGAVVCLLSKPKPAKLRAILFVTGCVLSGVGIWRVDDVAKVLGWY